MTTSGSNTIRSFASGGTSGTTSSITFSFDTSRLSGETSGVISGTGALTYAGAGTLTLSAANTYSGGTIVNSGSLIARGGLANATSNTLTANAGGTFIFGAADVFTNHTGTVQPTIVVNEGGKTMRQASGPSLDRSSGLPLHHQLQHVFPVEFDVFREDGQRGDVEGVPVILWHGAVTPTRLVRPRA